MQLQMQRGREDAAAVPIDAAVAGMLAALAAAASKTRTRRVPRTRRESKLVAATLVLSAATKKKWNDARAADPASKPKFCGARGHEEPTCGLSTEMIDCL